MTLEGKIANMGERRHTPFEFFSSLRRVLFFLLGLRVQRFVLPEFCDDCPDDGASSALGRRANIDKSYRSCLSRQHTRRHVASSACTICIRNRRACGFTGLQRGYSQFWKMCGL